MERGMKIWNQFWAVAFLCSTLSVLASEKAAPAGPEPEAGKGNWIVSTRSYWRYHYMFRPAQSFEIGRASCRERV